MNWPQMEKKDWIVSGLTLTFALVMWLFASCVQSARTKDYDSWAIRFSDGSEMSIKAPKYVNMGLLCASDEFSFIDGEVDSPRLVLIKEYTKPTGYIFHQHRHDGNHDIPYTICKKLSELTPTSGVK